MFQAPKFSLKILFSWNIFLQNKIPVTVYYVLLKVLPPVCMKYTARDESRAANIALGFASCYICHKTLIKSCILYTNEAAVFFKCFIVFYTYQTVNKTQFLGHFNTFIE